MTDPMSAYEEALNTVLHAWVTTYLDSARTPTVEDLAAIANRFERHAHRLRESAVVLEAALEKMRRANERLAARMVEHKQFFEGYRNFHDTK